METPETETEPQPGPEQQGLPIAPKQSVLNFNLAPLFLRIEPKWTEELASRVVKDDSDDRETWHDYMEMRGRAIDSYVGKAEKLTKGPAKGESKVHLPIFAKIVNRSHARQISLINALRPIPVPTGDEDAEKARMIGQHMEWEMRFKYPDWAAGFEVTSQQRLFGSAYRYIGIDPIERKRVHIPLSIRDISMPYSAQDHTPDLRDVDHYCITWRYPKHRILRLGRRGYYFEAKQLWEGGQQASEEKYDKTDAVTEAATGDGIGPDPAKNKSGRYELLERHGWELLPDSIDRQLGGTGVARRIAVTVEKSTKRVLRVVLMEKESPLDRLRYQNEMNAAMAERDAMAELQGIPPEMAQQMPLPEIEPIITTPVYPVFHYPFMRNPEGLPGLGIWSFAGPTNILIDELATEDLVGERIRNVITGFTHPDSGAQKGTIELNYGAMNEMEAPDGDINKAYSIVQWPPKGNGVFNYIRELDQQVQAVMSSTDQDSGVPGPSHETKYAAQHRAAAGQTAMTASLEMLLLPLAAEFKYYADLNAILLEESETFYTSQVDPATSMPQQRQVTITPEDYQADYDITFESDFRLEIDPGLGESAMQAYMMIKDDPNASPNMKLAAFKKVLRSLRQRDLAMMLPDEIPPPEPPQPMSQVDENAEFMNERDHPVLPDDDDVGHLGDMDEFERAGLYNTLSYTGRQNYDRHKRGHQAQAYQKAERLRRQSMELDNATAQITSTGSGLFSYRSSGPDSETARGRNQET